MKSPDGHSEMLNFEQLAAEAAKLDHAGVQAHVTQMQGQALTIPSVCALYKKVRPALVLIEKIWLIPASIRAIIKTFVGLMDTMCP